MLVNLALLNLSFHLPCKYNLKVLKNVIFAALHTELIYEVIVRSYLARDVYGGPLLSPLKK